MPDSTYLCVPDHLGAAAPFPDADRGRDGHHAAMRLSMYVLNAALLQAGAC